MTKLFKSIIILTPFFLLINEGWTSNLKDLVELSEKQYERNATLKIVDIDARDQLLELLKAAQPFRSNWSNRFQNKLDIFQGNAVFQIGTKGEATVSFYSYVDNDDPETNEKQPYKMKRFSSREEWSFTQSGYDAIQNVDYGYGINLTKKITSVSQSTKTVDLLFTMKSLFIQMFGLRLEQESEAL